MELSDWVTAGQNFYMAYGFGYMHNKNKRETCAIAKELGVEKELIDRFENNNNKYATAFYMEVGSKLCDGPRIKF